MGDKIISAPQKVNRDTKNRENENKNYPACLMVGIATAVDYKNNRNHTDDCWNHKHSRALDCEIVKYRK